MRSWPVSEQIRLHQWCAGIKLASEIYFNKSQDSLQIQEAATLIGMLKLFAVQPSAGPGWYSNAGKWF
ncbi:MAG: transglycosylase domain-containing protein [Saprospirales bacterium]|nr:transglycosylase domain-containing protein [Saprospirales bacterium]